MIILKKLCQFLRWLFCRRTKESDDSKEKVMTTRGPKQPSENDSSYKDYCQAYDAGALLDPLPDDYIKVRDIVKEFRGVRISDVLGGNMVDYQNPLSRKLGIKMVYNARWEVYVNPNDADVLRKHLSSK